MPHPESIRAHRRRRGWTLAAVALALATLAPGPGPRITHVTGVVEIGSGTPPAWKAARAGDAIAPGVAVRTRTGASAELVMGTRTVRLYENSVLRIPAEADGATGSNGPRAVSLDEGRSLFDVLRRDDGDRFDVRTPEVVVSVKGTRFLVDAGAAELASVAVFRGQVGVRGLAEELAHETLVRPGFTAFGGAGQPFELRLTPFEDPWDAWSQGAPPPRRAAAAPPAARAATLEAKKAAGRVAGADIRAHERAAEAVKREAVARGKRGKAGAVVNGKPGLAPPAAPDPGLALDGARPDLPANLEPPLTKGGGELDPLADALRRKDGPMPDGLLGSLLDGEFNDDGTGGVPPGSNPFLAGIPFTYTIQDDKMRIFGANGLYTVLTEDQVDDFLAGDIGAAGLGAPMVQLLMEYGVDPAELNTFLGGVAPTF